MSLRVVSYGGGVQSTALLVLAAQKEIDFKTFLFSNVGDDSEHPATLRFVREVAQPYANAHGIDLVTVKRILASGPDKGKERTLYQEQANSRHPTIPVRMANGAPGSRGCTTVYKVRTVGKWLKAHGATNDDPATVALGISVDEIERAKPGPAPQDPYQVRTYPLLDLGMNRNDCRRVIADAGLPVPPKSACFFCPFQSPEGWRKQKQATPELFAQSVALEDAINENRAAAGKDRVFLHRSALPLERAVDDQTQLPGMGDDCDSGFCFT